MYTPKQHVQSQVSLRVKHPLRSTLQFMDNNTNRLHQRELKEQIDFSPFVAAQRKAIEVIQRVIPDNEVVSGSPYKGQYDEHEKGI